MIKSYESVSINKTDKLINVIKKINLCKNNDNYYPVGIYSKNDKIIGILSLGDIRRISLKKVNLNELAINHLNKEYIFIDKIFFNSDLNNRINVLSKKKKIDFIITNQNQKINIIKVL